MKIICVCGGSYKGFYFNHLLKIKSCDMLIFNTGIIYDYITKDELFGSSIVTKEMFQLSKKLNCVSVAAVNVYSPKLIKSILVCDGDKIYTTPIKLGACVCVKGFTFIIGDRSTNYKNFNRIVLGMSRIYPNVEHCNMKKTYLFFDRYGLNFVKNKKIERKFSKCSKIILK